MAKINLQDATSLTNETSFITLLNENNAELETVGDTFLSLDGSTPNSMGANLDMNSYRIINLPAPNSMEEPLRLQDLADFNDQGSLTVPTIPSFPVLYATDYGIVVGTFDNSTALGALKTAIGTGSKTVLFPAGIITFSTEWDVSSLNNVIFQGMGGLDLTYSGTTGTVFKFTGTGSGNIINMQEHRGVWWKDLQVVYTSNSFTGTIFNCATTFSTGCGSGFENVQCYQITNNGHTAGQCFYLKNNVDVTWRNCYVSHATYGWVGLFTGESGETNMIKLENCTSIALTSAALVNPIIGWSLYSHNFEPSDTNTPSGILTGGSFDIKNLNLYSCVFADATANGTWINMPNNTYNFTMIGGGIFADAGTVTGMVLGNTFNGGLLIQGVLFSGLNIGVTVSATTTGAIIQGNNFLTVTTPISGTSNLDGGSLVRGNNPGSANILALTSPTVTTKISPTTNDGAPLGDTTHNFSDLFLASGGVINWNAGDVTATHASNSLTFAGATSGYTFDSSFGYPTGTGAQYTQATSKATTVPITTYTGEITMNAAALAAATIVAFSCSSSGITIGAGDVCITNHVTGGTLGGYTINAIPSVGGISIYVRNATAGSLSEAIVIRYVIIKGATT